MVLEIREVEGRPLIQFDLALLVLFDGPLIKDTYEIWNREREQDCRQYTQILLGRALICFCNENLFDFERLSSS